MGAAEQNAGLPGLNTSCTSWPLLTIDGMPCWLEHEYVELPDGRRGWYQRSNDHESGCLRAAVATITGVHWDDVGPMHTTRLLAEWCERCGLAMQARYRPDVTALDCDWLGVLRRRWDDDAHVFVAHGPELVHDPAGGMLLLDVETGPRYPAPVTPAEIAAAELALIITERDSTNA